MFFSTIGTGVLHAAALREEPVSTGVQNALIIQNIAQFLTAKDVVNFSHTTHCTHAALGKELAAIKREYDLPHNVWKYELSQDDAEQALQDLDSFQKKAKEYIDKQQENYGVVLNHFANNLGQEGAGKVISCLVSLFKSHKCEIVKLDLSFNQLKKIPEEVYRMPFLKELILAGNPVQYTAGIFKGLCSVQKLDLMTTLLLKIPEGLFGGLDNVSCLSLYSNSLTECSYEMLSPLTSLRTLNLCQNELRCLDLNGISVALPTLQKINITENPGDFISQLDKNCGKFALKYERSIVTLERRS